MPRRMVAFRSLVALVVLGGVEVCIAGDPTAASASSFALRDKVAAAVARDLQSGPATVPDAGNLQLLDPLLSLPSNSELHVTSVRAGYSPGSWLLRMDCASRRDCLPFHVVLHAPGAAPHEGLVNDLTSNTSGKSEPSRPQAKSRQLRPPVARSGDHVLLVEERSGLRLKVTAVCLQSGGLGDEIRVRNLATHRVVKATVAGKDLVRVE